MSVAIPVDGTQTIPEKTVNGRKCMGKVSRRQTRKRQIISAWDEGSDGERSERTNQTYSSPLEGGRRGG